MSKGNSQCVSGLSFYEILIPFFGEVRASMCLKRDQAESELQFDTADAQTVMDRLSLKSVELDDYLLVVRSRDSLLLRRTLVQ